MIPFRKSIGFRLLGISIILLAFPLLVDSFILIQEQYRHAIAEAKEYLIETAQKRALPLAQIQPQDKSLFKVVSYFFKLDQEFPVHFDPKLNEKLEEIAKKGNFKGIYLIKVTEDQKYIVTASNIPWEIGKDYTEFFQVNEYFTGESPQGEFSIYTAFSNPTLEPYFFTTHAIYRQSDHHLMGILALSESITGKLKNFLSEDTQRFPVYFALLFHPSTMIFAATDPALRFHFFRPLSEEYRHRVIQMHPGLEKRIPMEPLQGQNLKDFPFFEFEWNGLEQMGYIKRLSPDFSMLVYASKKAVFESPFLGFINLYSVYLLILIVGGTIAYLLTLRMAKPIQQLSNVMFGIQKGEIDLRYQQDSLGFEINELGTTFNKMLDAVLKQKKVGEEERVKREIFAQELKLGEQAQRSLLLQKMPQFPGVEVAEIYIPAIEVGGDFYDVFEKQDEKGSKQLVLAVADASGKGVQACFYSLCMRNMLRTYIKEYTDIGNGMSATNNLFEQDTGDTGMFVTIFLGVYDVEKRTFQYFSAGHNPAIVRREDGRIEVLRHHGMAMGFQPLGKQQAFSTQIEKGDVVVIYSDGITEAHNEKFELFGEERLIQLIQKEGGRSAAELSSYIVTQVNEFAGKAPQHDDITLLVMKAND